MSASNDIPVCLKCAQGEIFKNEKEFEKHLKKDHKNVNFEGLDGHLPLNFFREIFCMELVLVSSLVISPIFCCGGTLKIAIFSRIAPSSR